MSSTHFFYQKRFQIEITLAAAAKMLAFAAALENNFIILNNVYRIEPILYTKEQVK